MTIKSKMMVITRLIAMILNVFTYKYFTKRNDINKTMIISKAAFQSKLKISGNKRVQYIDLLLKSFPTKRYKLNYVSLV